MTDETPAPDDPTTDEATPKPKSGGSNLVFFVIMGVMGVAIVILVILLVQAKQAASEVKQEAEAAAHEEVHAGAEAEEEAIEEVTPDEEMPAPLFPLETLVVNLKDQGYLRAQIQIEFEGKEVPKRFYARSVRVRDELISTLAAKARADLLAPEGREQAKQDIIEVVNGVLGRSSATAVYFTQFVVQ